MLCTPPTQLTAAFFVASGVRKSWVILWQVVAIILWTGPDWSQQLICVFSTSWGGNEAGLRLRRVNTSTGRACNGQYS
ncbi:hypothetical protein H4V95_000464 [Arthrobacter sp. CAN_C5]|nr:hypothetical protein [Arthrobacter sp. CAN_C5]